MRRSNVPAAACFPILLASAALAQAPQAAPTPDSKWVAVIDGKEAPVPAIEMGDTETILRILDEGKNHNHVMDHLTYLTQKIGARLTGSTNARKANEFCRDQYTSWGLSNVQLDQWGTIGMGFDRGPSSGKLLLRREPKNDDGSEKPTYDTLRDFELTTLAWSRGTDGPVRGRIIKEPRTAEDLDAVREKLPGAWVLVQAPSPVGQRGIRSMTQARIEVAKGARKKIADGATPDTLSVQERLSLEPVAGYITTSRDERVWTGGAPGWRELTPETTPPDVVVVVRGSDYDAINSRLADKEPIEAEFDLKNTLVPGPVPVFNTIAEIPGTTWPDEVVIISAHLDSWDGPGSQGCTDNGTGSAVTLEAARILMAAGAKPMRTIRFINWTGEEQGLLGSKSYVDRHKDELDKISAVFVDDGGTNTEGGLPAPDVDVDYLAAATAPTNNQFYDETDKKYLNVNIRPGGKMLLRGGSSDHASFSGVGVPGFFWDEIGRADYPFGWHTQNDKLDLAIPEYLVQSSTNAAITAYRIACAPHLLPRPPKEDEPAKTGDAEPRRRRNSDPKAK